MANRNGKLAAGLGLLGAAAAAWLEASAQRRQRRSVESVWAIHPLPHPPLPHQGSIAPAAGNPMLEEIDREMARIEDMQQQSAQLWVGPVPKFHPLKPLPGSHTSGPYAALDKQFKSGKPKGSW